MGFSAFCEQKCGFLCPGILGEGCGTRVCILELKFGFLCLFWASWGRLQHAKRTCILEQKCGFLCLFWSCREGLEKGTHFGASVDFHALLGLVGGISGAVKGHAFWSVDFYTFFRLLGKAAAWKKSQNGDENCCLI